MKVLLLTNTAGQGHNATAKALSEQLNAIGAECRILDSYRYISPPLYQTIARGYLIATSITPMAYGVGYRFAEHKEKSNSKYSVLNAANSIMSLKLARFLRREFQPDVIICTHIFSAQLINAMKKNGRIRAKTIGIITDFTIHPFWQDVDQIDYFVTASELLTHQAVWKGIDAHKILPFGIPIQPKFSSYMEKTEARAALELAPDRFTVLVMGGSMGHGNLAGVIEQIDHLDNDFQVLAVCGNNKHAYQKIRRLTTRKKVCVYGFVDNVDVMMDAADCIITKPGGLTTSEALAKNLPILMMNPIPGQEERNVEFLVNNGLAVNVTNTYPVDEALYQLFLYPQKLKNMQSNIQLVGKPHATDDICAFVMKLCGKSLPT
ncbi:MGDG synthase family glycosyltransferase [Ethanoligenens sp.]|uniref:MGDG synthase family glycosyltransferase n=1 Tax=Ethanoligenens sp. TaxID=2099655 RepID=UPI0039EB90A1